MRQEVIAHRIQAPALGIFNKITPQYRLPYYWYLDPARQEEFNRDIDSLAKWIEGAIQRFRAGVKNSRVIELHDTNHYVFIVEERFTRRGGPWSFEKCASFCSMNEGACAWISALAARCGGRVPFQRVKSKCFR